MIKSLMPVVLLSGALSLLLHIFIEKKIIKNPLYFQHKNKEDNLQLGLRESMKIILGCDIKELLTMGQGVMLSFQAVSLCFF